MAGLSTDSGRLLGTVLSASHVLHTRDGHRVFNWPQSEDTVDEH